MLPPEVTTEFFLSELEGACAWAARHGIPLHSDAQALQLRAEIAQPDTGEIFYLLGNFDKYKALPPSWTFCDANWDATAEKRFFPNPVRTRFGSSIFHTKPVICVPFNRLAYAELDGPHKDWKLSGWTSAGGTNSVRANTIGDMLQIVRRDLVYTRGRMQ